MTIDPGFGWKNFEGGGADPALCGEDESGEIPPLGIINLGNGGLGIDFNFDCEVPITDIDIEVTGGVPPFIWAVELNQGDVTILEPRKARISLNAYNAGPTVHCSVEDEDRDGDQAYIIIGKAPFNVAPGDCNDFSHSLPIAAITYNCNDQIIAAGAGGGEPGTEKDLSLGNGFEADLSEIPTICEQANPIFPGVDDCGVPWCGEGGSDVNVCNSSIADDSPAAYLFANLGAGARFDIRTDEMKTNGCNPCRLMKDTDIVVTVTDAEGNSVGLEIHINA